MLIFWKVLSIYQNNFDIFANLYIFYPKIKQILSFQKAWHTSFNILRTF